MAFSILDFIPGVSAIKAVLDPVATITNGIIDWKKKQADATTEQERIRADENVKALEARRDVLVAEGSISRINAIIRALLALPVVILLWKIFVFDKVLGQWLSWRTDALDANLWNVVTAVVGFYFLYEGAVGVARIIKR